MILTLQRLSDLGACASQRNLFAETFGESVDVTPELCVSVADKFDWDWAATHLLSASDFDEYRRVKAAAWVEYQRVRESGWVAYRRAEASTWAEYRRVVVPAWAEYERVDASAQAEYRRTTARTFGELYSRSE